MSDDSPLLIVAKGLFSEGLRRLFSDSSFTAVHMAPSIEDALPLAESMQPSLMLVDLPDGCEVQPATLPSDPVVRHLDRRG